MPDFPRVATAAEVWAYGTRNLTTQAFPFTNPAAAVELGNVEAGLSGVQTRAARLDVAISTRSSHSAADVWAEATRTLTGITGTPRSDLLGVDATFEASTGTRATRIDRLASIEAFDAPIEGTLTMDGTEQNLILDEVTGNPSRFLEGYVDLSPMLAGDTIVIRQYISLVTPVSYRRYAEETYSGAQTHPAQYVLSKSGRYGIRLTIQQTAGTYRTIPYQFFRRRIA